MSIWNWITTYLDDGLREGNLEKYRLFRTTIELMPWNLWTPIPIR